MRWPFRFKKPVPLVDEQNRIQSSDPVVVSVKLKTQEAADEAKKAADKLNDVFQENGITLAIQIAAGGRHGH